MSLSTQSDSSSPSELTDNDHAGDAGPHRVDGCLEGGMDVAEEAADPQVTVARERIHHPRAGGEAGVALWEVEGGG